MVIYQKIIRREDARANRSLLYAFGDNLARVGYGGQAAELRDEPNAVGIPTKRAPYVVYTEADYDEAVAAIRAAINRLRLAPAGFVFPLDGVGTGRAGLRYAAPRIWEFLCAELTAIGVDNVRVP